MRTTKALFAAAIAATLAAPVAADDVAVQITAGLGSVDVMHGGQKITIMRNQDTKNTVNPAFAKTSRECPPFCIQPSRLAPGVETIGEAEVIEYAKRMSDGDETIVLVDSRTPDWVERGTIPSAMNVPWTKLNPAKGADPISIAEIMEGVFNVQSNEELMDFSGSRTAVMFLQWNVVRAVSEQHRQPPEVRLPRPQDQVVPRGHAGLGDPGTHHRSGRLTAPADAAMGGGPAAHRRLAP